MDLLQIVKKVDVIPYSHEPAYANFASSTYKFLSHDGKELGRIIPYSFEIFWQHKEFVSQFWDLDRASKSVKFVSELDEFEARNAALAKLAAFFRDKFDSLSGWRNELYVCYCPSKSPYFTVERSFAPILGIVMYGVHINGYIPPELSSDGEIKLWVGRRSLTKPTFPGMLDNTIAGGIANPYSIHETAIKESSEEANVAREYVGKNIVSAGVITYYFSESASDFAFTSKMGENYFVQPECEFIYDMVFDEETKPQINDDEVQGFELMTVKQVLEALSKGEFKPNCACVIIDFLIRKGIVTPENEPNYLEIVQRMHRMLPFSTI